MSIHLCFHGIGTCAEEREEGESRYWVSERLFLAILDGVAGCPHVELSFDDGNASDIQVALPALLARGLRATFFPLAGRLDDPASLSANDVRRLRLAGMSIGSHGWSHIPWRGLTAAEEHREMVDARNTLEQASGSPVTRAALPLGRYDRSSLQALRRAGYRTVYTSDRFPARRKSWLQARYSVTADTELDSVMQVVHKAPGVREARNLLVSSVKRLR